eukprot:1222671-Prymnesium_polylepis.2
MRRGVDDDVGIERIDLPAARHPPFQAARRLHARRRRRLEDARVHRLPRLRRRATTAARAEEAWKSLNGHQVPSRVDDAHRRRLAPPGARQAVVYRAEQRPPRLGTVVEDALVALRPHQRERLAAAKAEAADGHGGARPLGPLLTVHGLGLRGRHG